VHLEADVQGELQVVIDERVFDFADEALRFLSGTDRHPRGWRRGTTD
jgi:hypothetical protein